MKSLSDITAPVKVIREMLESDVQSQCARWARSRGYWVRKFSSMSQRSVPDCLFATELHGVRGYCVKFACEFKKPGTKPKVLEKQGVTVMSTEQQFEEQEDMRDAGWFVFECDDFDKFKNTVLSYERQCEMRAA